MTPKGLRERVGLRRIGLVAQIADHGLLCQRELEVAGKIEKRIPQPSARILLDTALPFFCALEVLKLNLHFCKKAARFSQI
jgi:hypothetical protein